MSDIVHRNISFEQRMGASWLVQRNICIDKRLLNVKVANVCMGTTKDWISMADKESNNMQRKLFTLKDSIDKQRTVIHDNFRIFFSFSLFSGTVSSLNL